MSLYDGFLANLLFVVALAVILASDREVDAADVMLVSVVTAAVALLPGAVGDPPQAAHARPRAAPHPQPARARDVAHDASAARCSRSSTS